MNRLFFYGGVGACVIVAIACLILAMVFVGAKEDNVSVRFNAGVSKAGELVNAPAETREPEIKKLVSEYLAIEESSDDPSIQSAAYLNAGVLMLWDYDEAQIRARLQGALQYFEKAAKICGWQKDRDACFFSEIQTNLDYARLLWGESTQRADSGQNSQVQKKSNEPPNSRDGKKSSASSLHQGEKDNNDEGSTPERQVMGSIRGAHSRELEQLREWENGGGSGFVIPPNLP